MKENCSYVRESKDFMSYFFLSSIRLCSKYLFDRYETFDWRPLQEMMKIPVVFLNLNEDSFSLWVNLRVKIQLKRTQAVDKKNAKSLFSACTNIHRSQSHVKVQRRFRFLNVLTENPLKISDNNHIR